MTSGKATLDAAAADPLDPEALIAWWVERARPSARQVHLIRHLISGRRAGR
jgi:hypothetical protein